MKRNVTFILAGVFLIALLGVVIGCGGDGNTTTTAVATDTTATSGAADTTASTTGASDTTATSAESTDTSGTSGGDDDGAKVFAATCAGCHGADGTGASGPDLTVRASLTKDRIVDQVTNGGTSMPPYGSQLSSEEISKVADYVLSDIVKQ